MLTAAHITTDARPGGACSAKPIPEPSGALRIGLPTPKNSCTSTRT
jgi:hypothetical protein